MCGNPEKGLWEGGEVQEGFQTQFGEQQIL
uniref:Uncharacterized protein n=1 Tax=Anguilla anguilla TaxID=7936 RepID=A0A0E9TU40_ANGAN